MSRTETPTAAVVGAGDISGVHLDALAALGVRVAAVVDRDLERASSRAAASGATPYPDVETMLASTDVDVVHVCTPHDEHLPVALAAIAAGRHVLVEKPLAHTLDAAKQLVAAAETAPGKVGVCLQNRYNPTSRAMKAALDDGGLGPVLAGSATVVWSRPEAYYAAKRWAGERTHSGGGVLINQAIHTIDLLQWLLGPVSSVAGRAARLLPIDGVDVEDTATFAMTHRSGEAEVRSTMWATAANAINQPVTLDVACESGSLSLRGDLTITDADGVATIVSDAPPSGAGPAYWGASHAALISDFYARLDDPEPFWISPREALASQWILSEVYAQSS
jgi:UDP-N-acetyl-2-amino-2-deoxyglucuronate dehydrogenase